MIKGLGNDILEIARLDSTLERLGDKFVERILTPEERCGYQQSKQPGRFLAKRFCVKEACAKALGTGIGRGVSWQHMTVTHDDFGKPLLLLSAGAIERMSELGAQAVHVSLSDEQHYVLATVIIE
ncbi:MAG: holo-ACP synthase [Candidatus Pelagadaptatus aseana]|uniref:holo-ACP synthase n=1 Tax=Candidatus Pelagadaptatus aseana TaxID=3120508 RepID=UPI0039B35889